MNTLAPIGHNCPPDPIDAATAPYADAIEEAGNWLDGTPVETEGQMQAVDALLAQIKAWRKDLDAAKKSATAPLHDAWKRELARWKPTEDDQQRIEKGLVAAVDGFKRRLAAEKEAARREAERAMWQAAEEAKRAAEAAQASDLEAQRAAAEKHAAFEAAQAAAKAAEADKVKGLRTYAVTEIVDGTAFARWLWQNDRAALLAFMDDYARRHALHIPGVVETRKERRAV